MELITYSYQNFEWRFVPPSLQYSPKQLKQLLLEGFRISRGNSSLHLAYWEYVFNHLSAGEAKNQFYIRVINISPDELTVPRSHSEGAKSLEGIHEAINELSTMITDSDSFVYSSLTLHLRVLDLIQLFALLRETDMKYHVGYCSQLNYPINRGTFLQDVFLANIAMGFSPAHPLSQDIRNNWAGLQQQMQQRLTQVDEQ